MAMPKPMFRNKDAWLKYRKDLEDREKAIIIAKKMKIFSTTIALILLCLALPSCTKDRKSTTSGHTPAASHTVQYDSYIEYEQYLEDEYNSYMSDQMYYEDEIKARWH